MSIAKLESPQTWPSSILIYLLNLLWFCYLSNFYYLCITLSWLGYERRKHHKKYSSGRRTKPYTRYGVYLYARGRHFEGKNGCHWRLQRILQVLVRWRYVLERWLWALMFTAITSRRCHTAEQLRLTENWFTRGIRYTYGILISRMVKTNSSQVYKLPTTS